ncbi:MAG TPA: carboxypeptidase regulatory-like domain-containing protein [Terriglobia bacterium]|nr:carboxypeptidase regulatory-like domain-containing protein [Terriglobia bacterium]
MRTTKALFCAAPVLLLCGATLAAQNISATISGTVTDPSGAVIPHATVAVRNNDTKSDVRVVQTDNTGAYVAALLPIGNYTVTIKAKGFQDWTANNVILHVGDHLGLNAQLAPGAVTQTVTVEASTTPVQTTNAAQASTITGTQIRELELNDRNFEQLVTLQPGVANGLPAQVGFGIENTSSISVNGSRTSANNWTVDGSDVNDTGSNATLLNVPSVDALAEFKLERGTYDAQYGRSGGGQVNVVTRSGTSQFHGDAYEFVRNDVFNANDFFANSVNTPTPPFRYNDFGYTIGGPFYIPGHYNTDKSKTFFFWSEEWRRTRTPGTNILDVPLPQELTGNFQGLATPNGTPVNLNPASAPAGCIANNMISPACFSQNAAAYVQNVYSKYAPNLMLPQPAPGLNSVVGQYIIPESALNNFRQEILRVDQKITNKIQVFGRYMQDNVPTTEPGGLFAGSGLPGISSTATNAPGRNFVAHVTMSLSPTLLNEAAFNYSWGAINSNITGVINNPAFVNSLNETSFPYKDPYNRVPGVSISGVQGVGIPVSPYFERNIDKQVYDNVTIVRGNHTIRTGATLQYLRKSENAVNPTNGSFSFNSVYSGGAYNQAPFANFLLGDAYSFSQASRDIIPDLYMPDVEAYVQDDWKVRSNFTLNLGLRWAYLPTPTDRNMILDNFDPSLYNPANAPGIDPMTGNFLPGQALNPGNYANGIIVAQNACIPGN